MERNLHRRRPSRQARCAGRFPTSHPRRAFPDITPARFFCASACVCPIHVCRAHLPLPPPTHVQRRAHRHLHRAPASACASPPASSSVQSLSPALCAPPAPTSSTSPPARGPASCASCSSSLPALCSHAHSSSSISVCVLSCRRPNRSGIDRVCTADDAVAPGWSRSSLLDATARC